MLAGRSAPVERPEEFGPGLDPELMEMVAAVAEMEMAEPDGQWSRTDGQGDGIVGKVKDKLTP